MIDKLKTRNPREFDYPDSWYVDADLRRNQANTLGAINTLAIKINELIEAVNGLSEQEKEK